MLRRREIGRPDEQVPLGALFTSFLKVSLCGFGGGLIWARRIVVEQRHWMDEQEFAETLTLCQLMPGPNIVGITVCVGAKTARGGRRSRRGRRLYLVPWTVGLASAFLSLDHAELAMVQKILGGLSAAAAGLLIGTGLRLLMPHRSHPGRRCS